MIQVNLSEAKTHFSKYALLVKQGKTVILCERNVPFVEIRAVRTGRNRRRFGLSKELIGIGPKFFAVDAEIEDAMNKGPLFPKGLEGIFHLDPCTLLYIRLPVGLSERWIRRTSGSGADCHCCSGR